MVAIHVNAVTAGFVPTGPIDPAALDEPNRKRLARLEQFRTEGSAFFRLQATRPQTLAYALADSPVGLLAGWA